MGEPRLSPFFCVSTLISHANHNAQYRKHLYIIHLNTLYTRSHSLKCKWSQKSQGGNRSESCNIYWTEDICLQITALHEHTFQDSSMVPVQLSHTVLFQTVTERKKVSNCNYIHKTTGQLSFRMHLCLTPRWTQGAFQARAHIFVWLELFEEQCFHNPQGIREYWPPYQAEQQLQWTAEFLTFVLINIPLCLQDTQYSISVFGITRKIHLTKGMVQNISIKGISHQH